MTRRALYLALLIVASCAVGCASLGKPAAGSQVRDRGFRARPVILWVDAAGCPRALASAEASLALAVAARQTGVTHLAIEARDARGRDSLDMYRHVRLAAEQTGLRLAVVLPLFVAGSDAPREAQSEAARWTGEGWAIDPMDGKGGAPAMLSPAVPANRAREIEAIARIAADPKVDILLITELGFRDPQADVSPAARRAFESWTGTTMRSWPEAVMGTAAPSFPYGPQGRGPLWNSWVWWRAALLRDFLAEIKGALVTSATQPPPTLAIVVDAPYPAHQRAGLNWAAAGTSATADNPWLPMDYDATAAGHLADAVVLGFWEPGLATVADAEARGFAWWASVEGGGAAARRYRSEGTGLWAALDQDGTMSEDPALLVAARSLDGVLILSASKMYPEFR